MKSIKIIFVLVLIFLFCLPAICEKRVKRMPMKELTDIESPNYVPYPYPKNRTEVIADLMYYIKRYCVNPDDGSYSVYTGGGGVPVSEKILVDLLSPRSPYEIGKIFKVKNRIAQFPDGYSWIILVMDRDGNVTMRIAMHATGLLAMYGAIVDGDLINSPPKQRERLERHRRLITEEDVKNILSEILDHYIDPNEIKKVERIAFFSSLGDLLDPIWEIKMADGTIYYYSQNRDMLYGVDKKVKWKKNEKGYRPDKRSLVPNSNHLADTLNDELLALKEIHRKNK